jgi:hypothetical protein
MVRGFQHQLGERNVAFAGLPTGMVEAQSLLVALLLGQRKLQMALDPPD